MNINEFIEKFAREIAKSTAKELSEKGVIKYAKLNSFKRTEEILRLYPKLSFHDATKETIDKALKSLSDGDEYFGVIESYYFDNMTFEEIATIYDVDYRTISRNRTRLVIAISKELFPADIARDILEI